MKFKIFNFLKKKKTVEISDEYKIYSYIVWNKINNELSLYSTNMDYKIKDIFCAKNLYHIEDYFSTSPFNHIFIPKILYDIDWIFIFKDGIKLKSFKITFFNYMKSIREYSVLLEAINEKGKIITDTFSSTSKVFIDPYELTDNILKFLKYAEEYK